jgi:hypothetical protein
MLDGGFTLLETPRFFELGLLLRLKGRETVLPFDCKRWWRFPHLARYACWLETVLDRALPDETLRFAALEFRHEPAGFVDKTIDTLHADGSYIRSVCTLYGPSTIYRDGKAEKTVPFRQTLVMTATERTRALGVHCTLHRRPGAGPERAVVVCSFEPRRGNGHPKPAYRQAARDPIGAIPREGDN